MSTLDWPSLLGNITVKEREKERERATENESDRPVSRRRAAHPFLPPLLGTTTTTATAAAATCLKKGGEKDERENRITIQRERRTPPLLRSSATSTKESDVAESPEWIPRVQNLVATLRERERERARAGFSKIFLSHIRTFVGTYYRTTVY